MLSDLKISYRIGLVGAILLLGLLITAAVSLFSLHRLSVHAGEIAETGLETVQAMSEVSNAVGALRRYERDLFLHVGEGGVLADDRKRWDDAMQAAEAALVRAGKVLHAEVQKQGLLSLQADIETYKGHFTRIADDAAAGKLGTPGDADAAMRTYRKTLNRIDTQVAELLDGVRSDTSRSAAELAGTERATFLALGLGVLLVVAAALPLVLWIGRSISRPLQQIEVVAQNIVSRQDLTTQAPPCGQNEIGHVVGALNEMIAGMRTMIHDVGRVVVETQGNAGKMVGVAQSLASASRQQSEAIYSSAASLQQLTVSIRHVSDIAAQVNEDSASTRQAASEASLVGQQAAEQIHAIAGSIAATAGSIESLNRRSEEIGSIVRVINEIAEQTNLLALNAAIEAARAGEQGRGFAVVADEVRKLAERTTQATREISGVIQAVQQETGVANQRMQAATDGIQNSVAHTEQVLKALARIGDAALEMAAHIATISSALNEQSEAGTQVSQRIEDISRMGEENASAAQVAQEISSALASTANELNRSVARFKT